MQYTIGPKKTATFKAFASFSPLKVSDNIIYVTDAKNIGIKP